MGERTRARSGVSRTRRGPRQRPPAGEAESTPPPSCVFAYGYYCFPGVGLPALFSPGELRSRVGLPTLGLVLIECSCELNQTETMLCPCTGLFLDENGSTLSLSRSCCPWGVVEMDLCRWSLSAIPVYLIKPETLSNQGLWFGDVLTRRSVDALCKRTPKPIKINHIQ